MINATVDVSLPARGKELRHKLETKQTTMQEFMLEICYWLLSTIDELRFRPLPTMPNILKDYYSKKSYDKDYKVEISFWRTPAVEAYTKQVSEIDALNRSNEHWLREMKQNIPQEDIVAHQKISTVLRGF